MDIHFGYHQFPLREGDKVRTTFWGIDLHGKDYLHQWSFSPFGFKNVFAKFQKIMDWVLANISFVKCYINDIIVFSLTSKEHMQHL